MNRRYQIALIGCDVMGEAHASQIHHQKQIEIAYACDTLLEKSVKFQEKYHIAQISKDYRLAPLSG